MFLTEIAAGAADCSSGKRAGRLHARGSGNTGGARPAAGGSGGGGSRGHRAAAGPAHLEAHRQLLAAPRAGAPPGYLRDSGFIIFFWVWL